MQNDSIYRIIDANVNRSSEALRVLEDCVRFIKDSKGPSKKLKDIRHFINDTFSKLDNLILYRESQLDIGREVENKSFRKSIRDVIRANCKRLEESLRVLSEYGQLLEIDTKKLEEYRYEIYTIEKELIKNERLIRLQNAKLYLVASTGDKLSTHEFLSVIEKSIKGGIDIIQLREKHKYEKTILALAKEIKKLISGTEVLFIINDRVDLALAADADGVHLGQDDMPIEEARKITPNGFIIGLSTHSATQGEDGLNSSVDYLGVGPVFLTPTKPDYKAAGLEYVTWANKNMKDKPWFAIGGINEENIKEVVNAGASKTAIVRAVMNSKDPYNTVKLLKEKLSIKKDLTHV